jgi:hypothetical protein
MNAGRKDQRIMAQYEGSYQRQGARTTDNQEVSGWALSFVFFAGVLMVLTGSFHVIEGFAAVLGGDFYTVTDGYALKFDVNTWGWIHIVSGVVLVVAGMALFSGSLIAKGICLVLSVASIVWSFFSIPYYPVWAILIIVFNIGVIWALTTQKTDVFSE